MLCSYSKILLLCVLLTNTIILAQGEANIWYFGENAGLDFNSGSPVALLDGQLDTFEGCATISNPEGSLLFYTDGITVWDKTHVVMPNGTGLSGNSSSTQSAIVVPRPDFPDIYYIFAVDAQAGSNGLTYSEVDLSLNGGNGAVTAIKNVPLATPTTEKITAIEQANGIDFWVVGHRWDSNEFITFEVTAAGVNTTPIVSATGQVHTGDNDGAIGYMKISPNGEKLALAKTYENSFVELFDFDTVTGIISNPIFITGIFQTELEGPYGIEFSPNSNLLYISDVNAFANTIVHQLDITFNNATDIINSDSILYNGQNFIAAIQLAPDGKIYLANAYLPFLDVIESPNEIGAAAGYSNQAIDLNGRFSVFGLPPFIQSFFNFDFTAENLCAGNETEFTLETNEDIISVLWVFGDGSTSTDQNPTHTYAAAGTYTVTVTVNTQNNTRTISDEITIFDTPVANKISDYFLCDDSSNDMMEEFDLNTKIPEVLGNQSAALYEVAFYENLSDAENDINRLSLLYTNTINNQEIFARIFTIENNDCNAITSFLLIVTDPPIANEVSDFIVCDDSSGDMIEQFDLNNKIPEVLGGQSPTLYEVAFYENLSDAEIDINRLPLLYTNITNNQEIFARIYTIDDADCFEVTSFLLSVIEPPIANNVADVELCNDNEPINLEQFNDDVLGQQSSAEHTITFHISQEDADNDTGALPLIYQPISNPEQIFVRIERVTDSFCYATTSFFITLGEEVEAFEPEALTLCDDATLDEIEVFDLSLQNEMIINGQTGTYTITYYTSQIDATSGSNPISNQYTNTSNPQTIFARIGDSNNPFCFATTSFQLIVEDCEFFIPQGFSPNNDGLNDVFEISGLNKFEGYELQIYNRYGQLIYNGTNEQGFWNGIPNYGLWNRDNLVPVGTYYYVLFLNNPEVTESHTGNVYVNY